MLCRRDFLAVAAGASAGWLNGALLAAPRVEWKAGAAAVNISPRQSIWMGGYAARNKPSEGVERELYAKALALENGRGRRVVIITSDLLGLPRSVAERIAERLGKIHGLRRDAVLLNSSHTHSGPVLLGAMNTMYPLDEAQLAVVRAYTEELEDRVVRLAGAALNELAPARLSFGRGEAGFAVNRRVRTETGYKIGVNREAPVDHHVNVLCVERPNGSIHAILFGYACHNTTLNADNYRIHSDYAGVAQDLLEKQHPGAIALFMLGCAGDANPEPRGTVELANAHGKELAAAVDKALRGRLRPLSGPLRTVFDRVDLPFAPFPTREEWQARLQDADPYRQRQAREMLKIVDENGQLAPTYPYPIQVLQFDGDLTLVGLAGEVVIDYALRFERELGADKLWVAAYCNDVFAYIASRRVLQEGGYEASTSMIYYGQPGPWAPQAEDVLVAKAEELVKSVR